MAESWRFELQAVHDLHNPRYRVGDLARKINSEDTKIKDVVLELSVAGRDDAPRVTRPFDVDERGDAKVDQVLFVPRPPAGQPVLVRAVKAHKLQKDALIGEAEVDQARGRQRLELIRHGKPRGLLTVNVTEGILAPPPKAAPPGGGSPTAKLVSALKGKPDQAASAGSGGGAAAAQVKQVVVRTGSSCFAGFTSCVAGLLNTPASASKRFLEQKRKEPGVLRRPSGLMYKVLRAGRSTRHPCEDTPCDCNYRGSLINGKEFDSSFRHGKPTKFRPNEVIKGWSEALQLMVEGDSWELYIPSELAYGERGVDGVIPGHSALIFQVELVKVRR